MREALKRDLTAAGYPTRWDKSKPAGVELDRMSLYEWIESRVPGGHASAFGRLLDAAYNEEYGAETKDQSPLNVVYLLGYRPGPRGFSIFGQSDERWHVVGGNQRLPDAIAATLTDIRTGWRMTSVARNRDGTVALAFDTPSGSANVTAARVILTVPFQVLRTLDISRAGFDERKLQAITQLGSGSNAKLLLQFTSRYWNTTGPWGVSSGDSYTDLGYQNTWETTRAQPGSSGILVKGQYVAFGGYEAVPQGAVHFAGEHCSQNFQGYMEGAAREGKRAALEVAHALNGM